MTFLEKFFNRHPAINNQKTFAVAVSGGPDSMALAHMLLEWGHEQDKNIHLLTVDHGLRPEAKDEAKMISDWVDSLKYDHSNHIVFQWEGDKPQSAIMEAARQARYSLMADYCHEHNIETLFIAHHQDDQAETFLMRLSKGSGLDGLAAMGELYSYERELMLARPLLETAKETLVEYCDSHHIPYANDPSNHNEDYMRPRLRKVMSALEEEGLSTKRLAVTARRLARAREALEKITKEALQKTTIEKNDKSITLDFTLLQNQPEDIGLRVIQQALEEMRPEAHYQVRMEKFEELFDSLWFDTENYKPRTLGGCKFTLKHDKATQNTALYIEKEEG